MFLLAGKSWSDLHPDKSFHQYQRPTTTAVVFVIVHPGKYLAIKGQAKRDALVLASNRNLNNGKIYPAISGEVNKKLESAE